MVERANATNLIAAGAWATTTALLVRECCLLAGALVGVAALLRCLHRGRAGPELLAWIALLAAAARELPTAPQPPLGPVHFAGTVVEVRDTEAGSALVRLESAGQLLQLHVDDGGAL